MDCRQVRARMLDEIEGEVGGKLSGSFWEHIRGCSECRKLYEQMVEAYRLLQTTPQLEINPDTYSRILQRGKALLERKGSRRELLRLRFATATALALVVFALAFAFMKGNIASKQLAQREGQNEIYAIEYVTPPPVKLTTYTF